MTPATSITYVMLVAGVKNHHLKSISTPLLFFAQLVFLWAAAFFASFVVHYKPYKLHSDLTCYQTSPKQQNRLQGLLANLFVSVAL